MRKQYIVNYSVGNNTYSIGIDVNVQNFAKETLKKILDRIVFDFNINYKKLKLNNNIKITKDDINIINIFKL